MIIGIPKEIKADEYRVALTPVGVKELVHDGHNVYIESLAGVASGFNDELYEEAGATLLQEAHLIYDLSELIIKVKEPTQYECHLLRSNQILFTFLHLAANEDLTKLLLKENIYSFAYETLEVNNHLPLLEPMSELAGKMASLMGAVHLGVYNGGSGIFASGVVGTSRAKVMILGGGVAGKAAAEIAAGLGADITILDINTKRLSYLSDILPANVATLFSSEEAISKLLPFCDIVIGTVLIPGAKAPKLITNKMLTNMKKGSLLIDVSIDQGGCFESSYPTTHAKPTFTKNDILHYCVANMPGAYPQTSTYALSNATLVYIKSLAKFGAKDVCNKVKAMQSALNTFEGKLYNKAVGEAHKIESFDWKAS